MRQGGNAPFSTGAATLSQRHSMLPFLLLAAATATPDASQRFKDCVALIRQNAEKAIAEAEAWRTTGGGLPARQCLGLAYAAAERWPSAATAFEQAARDAELQRDGRAANFWVQAGNAALANDEPVRAKTAFDRALALPVLSEAMRGETLMDRARAGVAADDPAAARTDLDAALKLVPEDPMGWLLSATLARRQKELPRAEKDIREAARLAPEASAIAYEQGNVAYEQGAYDLARGNWERAVALDKAGDGAGNAARMAIAKLETEAAPTR
jgi:tetratricopeptide (TPR) repeat protein